MFYPDWGRLAALVDKQSTQGPLSRAKGLCALCQAATGVSGVALSVAGTEPREVTSTVCGTDELSLRLEELQLGLAEGPIVDALSTGRAVSAPHLADDSDLSWVWFGPAAIEAGALAVFVHPLCEGETRLGALSLYRSTSGDLTAEQLDDFEVLAHAATIILLPGYTASRREPGSWAVNEGTGFQPEVHQAVGAVMVDLHVDADDALARLRGQAFVSERLIGDVAHDIVAGRLRLERDAA